MTAVALPRFRLISEHIVRHTLLLSQYYSVRPSVCHHTGDSRLNVWTHRNILYMHTTRYNCVSIFDCKCRSPDFRDSSGTTVAPQPTAKICTNAAIIRKPCEIWRKFVSLSRPTYTSADLYFTTNSSFFFFFLFCSLWARWTELNHIRPHGRK